MPGQEKRIAILIHCKEPTPGVSGYAISPLARIWTRMGYEVVVVRSLDHLPEADLLFLHVDLSVVPEPYLEAAAQYPRSVNLHIADIRKSVISQRLVRADDDYDGPVVVKTNLNHMGIPEQRLLNRPAPTVYGPTENVVASARGYRLFADKKQVPDLYFEDPDWVVERFLPERRDGLYQIRFCSFLGYRWNCVRRSSASEFVVSPNFTPEREPIRPHPEIVSLKKTLGFDYGKFDYVEHDGHAILLDANKTPGGGGDSLQANPVIQAEREHLALGIDEFFR